MAALRPLLTNQGIGKVAPIFALVAAVRAVNRVLATNYAVHTRFLWVLLPRRRIRSDPLEERGLVLHHNCTPDGNISRHRAWEFGEHECRAGFRDVGAATGVETDNVRVGLGQTGERGKDAANGCLDSFHDAGLNSVCVAKTLLVCGYY